MGAADMTTTIIDAQGQVRDCSAPADIAVKDMGCVALRRHGSGSLEVLYRPSAVAPMALLKAVELLDASGCERVALTSWATDRQTTVIRSPAGAIEHMVGRATEAQSARERHFLFQRLAPGAVAADAAFGPIYDTWRTRPGVKDASLMQAVRAASCGRYLEVDPRDGASNLVLSVVGEGYSLYGNGWKSVAVGGRFEDMPDYVYACRASQAYREVFRTGQPIFEDVTALVRLLRAGTLLLKYRRAILPVGGDGEHPALLLGATLDQSVTRLSLA
jgi:hypothetical protein